MNDTILKQVDIPEDLCNYAQRLNYEMQGYKTLLMSILRCGDFNYNQDTYRQFMAEYQKVNMEFSLLMEELKTKYGEEYKDIMHTVEMYILFSENAVRFVQRDATCSPCSTIKR